MAGIHIYDWMINDLGLSGNELLVFATVYTFSQDDESEYMGGAGWLSGFLNISRRQVANILNALTGKGYILKRTENLNGVILNRFRVCSEISTPMKKLHGGYEKISNKNNKGNNKELYNNSSSLSEDKNISSSIDSNIIEERRPKQDSVLKILNKFPVVMSDFRAVDAISGWIESRKKTNKKPPTDRAIELAIRKAIRFSEETPQHSVADYFDNATLNGWQGIFQFKDGESVTGNKVSYQKNIRVAPDYNPKYVPQKATKFSFDEEDS